MVALYHTVAQTNVLPLKCRQQPWCELCMYTNELCCRMLSWWLPSLLGIDPSRVKTGRKEVRDRQQKHSFQASHRDVQCLFTEVLSNYRASCGPSFELHQHICFLFFFPLDECKSQHGNGNYSQLFLLWKFWLLPVSGKPKMGYVLTANDNKVECPLPPQDPLYNQMCFDWANENLSSKSDMLDLSSRHVVVQVWIHRGSTKVDTLPALINILTQMRNCIIFIDEKLLGLYRKALNRHLARGLSWSHCVYLWFDVPLLKYTSMTSRD